MPDATNFDAVDGAGESFEGLLLRHRGRTGLTQRELASRAGVSKRSVQDWEAGLNYPGAQHLQSLIDALLQAGGLATGREAGEAAALWSAALRLSPRMRTPFDPAWFGELQARRTTGPQSERARASRESTSVPVPNPADNTAVRRQDWGEAPDVLGFRGRVQELTTLHDWVTQGRCRMLALVGMGGIGKTTLAARLAGELAPSFELVYWRSLRNAPPLMEWLGGAIGLLSSQKELLPETESGALLLLLQLLRERRCLLVLDNFETLLDPNRRGTGYRDGYDGFGRLLQLVGESSHQSCLLMTSREMPKDLDLALQGGGGGGARGLELHGLGIAECQALLGDKQLSGEAIAWRNLVERYAGNGLALKVVGETIRQVFDGDIAGFLEHAGSGTVFGGIRRLLASQLERLSQVEQDVLTCLAVEREPVSLAELARDMGSSVGRGIVIDAIETLRRRSLVERGERGGTFTLQSMVLEYVTDRLVERISIDIEGGQPALLQRHALVKAQAKDYIRHTQERLIGQPVLQQLTASIPRPVAERRLLDLLENWRTCDSAEQGYGPGNVVNLLRLLRGDLRGLDLSRLSIRQAYLQEVDAQDASLAAVHLSETVLAAAFNYPTAVALSADGLYLTVGTSTGEVYMWRVADRMLLLAVQGHDSTVPGVALSGDGQMVVSGSQDGAVKLWETRSGRLLTTLPGHTQAGAGQASAVCCVALSRDDRIVASGSLDATVRLWDAPSGRLLASLRGHAGAVWGVALSGDGRLVASGSLDKTVKLWDVDSGRLLTTLEGHPSEVWCVALSGDGQLVVSGSQDGTIKLWEAGSGRLLATLHGHTGAVQGVAVSGDGRVLASGSFDGTIKLWDASTGQLLTTLEGHTSGVWCVALSGDGQMVASGSWDGTIKLWEVRSGRVLATQQGHTSGVCCVALSENDQLLVSGSQDATVRLWDAPSGRLLTSLRGHTGAVWGVALSGDGRLVASGSWDKTVNLWEAGSGRLLATLHGHAGTVQSVALSGDGRLVVSGSQDGTVKLWESASGRLLTTLEGHTHAGAGQAGAVWCVALTRDGRLVASGSQDGTVKLWEASTGRLLASLEGHTRGVTSVALSGDGSLAASGSWDGTVKVWDAERALLKSTLQGDGGTVEGVALNGDKRLVVSANWDGTVKLWELSTGRMLASMKGHTGAAHSVVLSEDGGLAASGSYDGTVKLWDVASRASLRTLRGDRCYERTDITGLTGVTGAQRGALLALGAVERA